LKVAVPSRRSGRSGVVLVVFLAFGMSACSGAGEDTEEVRQRRARQMRDVSHMIDAMEAPPSHDVPARIARVPQPTGASAARETTAQGYPTHDRHLAGYVASILAAMLATGGVTWHRRRRKRRAPARAAPSIAGYFAQPPGKVEEVPCPTDPNAPPRTWIYRTSRYEAPVLYMLPEPVDLLVYPAQTEPSAGETHSAPCAPIADTSSIVPTETTASTDVPVDRDIVTISVPPLHATPLPDRVLPMTIAPAHDRSSPFWTTRYGITAAVPADDAVSRSLQAYGEWAEHEADLVSGLIQAGNAVLEFGADFGAHAMWMSQAVGPHGQVHLVEPRRIRFQRSCANLALNGLDNVFTHAVWLGRVRGQLTLDGTHGQETVRSVPLDSLKLDALHLLKINEANAIVDLLAGGAETLKTHRPLIYARLSGMEQAQHEVEAIKALGYRVWSHTPYLFNAGNHAGSARNLFPGVVQQNIVAAPADSAVTFADRPEL
jgi:FkbM family methyltransferase